MKNILIIDIETTGFSSRRDKIVEIGIVSLDLDTGNKEILFDQVMHEDGLTEEIVNNSWIVNNSSLTTKEIMDSRHLHSFFIEVQDIITDYPLGATAFNNIFDFGFMKKRGFKLPRILACPMRLLRPICNIYGKRGVKNPTVQEAWYYFFGNTGYIEKHRGADDAYHEADIVYELYKRGIFKI